MTRILPTIALLALALSACSGDRSPAGDAGAAAAPDVATAVPAPTGARDADAAPAGTAQAGTAAPGSIATAGDARMDGYGVLDFGMTAEESLADWTAGRLQRLDPPGDPRACFHMSPAGQATPAELAFMFEDDMFLRYSVEGDLAAPGGGRRGMSADALQALYGGALAPTPHKYVEGGQYLAIETTGPSPTRLVFELDADGTATSWRVGVTPQVDYVEGCS